MNRLLACLPLLLVACRPEPAPRPPPSTTTFGGDRPVTLTVPDGYDHDRPTPLVVVLHGFGATGFLQSEYLGLPRIQDDEGFLLAAPDGTPDSDSRRFWNAGEACCDFGRVGVDDVAYLSTLVRDISAEYNVDSRRVFLVGHSNGGFMSYRLACERADLFAGLVSIAGADAVDTSGCRPSRPVSVLQIHGDADTVVRYEGRPKPSGLIPLAYPSAAQSVAQWAQRNGCTGGLESAGRRDLEAARPGAETRMERHVGCPAGGAAELWTIEGGSHLPGFSQAEPEPFARVIWSWLNENARR